MSGHKGLSGDTSRFYDDHIAAALQGQCYSDIVIEGIYLRGDDLEGVHFREAIFDECDFTHADLSNAYIQEAYFRRCNFNGTNFSESTIIEATFEACKFEGAFADEMHVLGLEFMNSELSIACEKGYWKDVQAADSEFIGCIFKNMDLGKFKLVNCDFSHVCLEDSSLEEWSLPRTTIEETYFVKARKREDMDFSEAIALPSTLLTRKDSRLLPIVERSRSLGKKTTGNRNAIICCGNLEKLKEIVDSEDIRRVWTTGQPFWAHSSRGAQKISRQQMPRTRWSTRYSS